MRVLLAGAGAYGAQHGACLRGMDGIELICLVDPDMSRARHLAKSLDFENIESSLPSALERHSCDAAVLATPTQLHAQQTIQCLKAGLHVQTEIPLATSLADVQAVLEAQRAAGLVAMCGHTRRFNRSHAWLHAKLRAGALNLHHLVANTYFLRRSNLNALGQARCWIDHLLWHHAAHTVDLFQYQTDSVADQVHAVQGPLHHELNIALDMSVQMKNDAGQLCTLALSFNNDGPIGTQFRYICEEGTFVAYYDDLVDGHGAPMVMDSMREQPVGLEAQNKEFFSAIRAGRQPEASVASVLDCYRTLDRIERAL